MTHRVPAAAFALALALTSLTACTSSSTSSADPAAAKTAAPAKTSTDQDASTGSTANGSVAAGTACTPRFDDGQDGSGITRSGSTLTATMSLDCHNQQPDPLTVALALFYRPNPSTGTTTYGSTSVAGAQAIYTTSAACKVGLWYIGTAVGSDPTRGPQITITTCH